MDVLQAKVTPSGVSRKWLVRAVSVAVMGVFALPAVVDGGGAFAATGATTKAAKQAPARSAAVKRSVGAKKAVAKSAVSKNAKAKSVVSKGAATRKAPVKKAPVNKAPVKKAPVKKAPVKKAVAKSAVAKKAVTRPGSKTKIQKVAKLGAQSAAVAAGTAAGVVVSKNLTEKKAESAKGAGSLSAPVSIPAAGTSNAPTTGTTGTAPAQTQSDSKAVNNEVTTPDKKVAKPVASKTSIKKPLKKVRMRRMHVMP